MQLLTKENICHKIVRERTLPNCSHPNEQEGGQKDAENRIQGSHRL